MKQHQWDTTMFNIWNIKLWELKVHLLWSFWLLFYNWTQEASNLKWKLSFLNAVWWCLHSPNWQQWWFVRARQTVKCRPTGSFEAVSDGPRPADAVDQRTVHVTPEVVCPVFTLLVDQTKTTADHLQQHKRTHKYQTNLFKLWETGNTVWGESHLFNQSDSSPTQVSFIHHLHPHLPLKRNLHAVLHLNRTYLSFRLKRTGKNEYPTLLTKQNHQFTNIN